MMDMSVLELANRIGQMCTFAALALHLAAALIPMNIGLRSELKACTKECGGAGLLFLIFGWLFAVQTGDFAACAQWFIRFSHYYVAVFLILVIGCALLHSRQSSDAQQVGRTLKRSALIYGIVFFLLGILLG